MENTNQNTTEIEILNPEPNLLLREDSSEKEEDIENELETKIVTRQINATKTTAHEELTVSMEKELNYDLIKFNMLFISSEDCKYSWTVYHTPKEVRKHIRNIVSKISNQELQLSNNTNINPIILQINHHDKDVINNLPIIAEFYLHLFKVPNFQNNPFLLNFFNISGNSFLKQNDGHKPYEGWVEKKVDKNVVENAFNFFVVFLNYVYLKLIIKGGFY